MKREKLRWPWVSRKKAEQSEARVELFCQMQTESLLKQVNDLYPVVTPSVKIWVVLEDYPGLRTIGLSFAFSHRNLCQQSIDFWMKDLTVRARRQLESYLNEQNKQRAKTAALRPETVAGTGDGDG